MKKILASSFFNRSTLVVARELLGKFLVRRWKGLEITAMITEVEAYDGFEDKASHASRGMTARNAPMFGPAGRWYVYLVYGTHEMLNIVTGSRGYPAAILIRAVSVVGTNITTPGVVILDGPGKLTKFLHVDRALNGKFASRRSGLWIEDWGVRVASSQIAQLPRIGVGYAGKVWAGKRRRFQIKNEK